MRFVSVRDLRGKSAEIWKKLSKGKDIIITSNGRPIAVLSPVSEDNLEESLATLRRARAIQAVDAMQSHSTEIGVNHLSFDEIDAEVKAVRKNRHK